MRNRRPRGSRCGRGRGRRQCYLIFPSAAMPEVRHPEFLSYKSQYEMRGGSWVGWMVSGRSYFTCHCPLSGHWVPGPSWRNDITGRCRKTIELWRFIRVSHWAVFAFELWVLQMHLEFTLNLTIYFSLLHVPTGSCPLYPITPEVTNPSALIAGITPLWGEQLQATFEISWAAQFDFSPKTDDFNPFPFSFPFFFFLCKSTVRIWANYCYCFCFKL